MERPISDMIADARQGRTRFDSQALRRALAAGVPAAALKGAIDSPTFDRYLVLEALRTVDAAVWQTIDARLRLAIYADQLKHASFFNDWGFPGLGMGDVGPVFIGQGHAAVRALEPLLDDRREAVSFGSEEQTMSRSLHNRVCDYALYFITVIRGEPFSYPEDPAERDRMIVALKQRLGPP